MSILGGIIKSFDEEKYAEYMEYKSESKACGYEVESFKEWLGEPTGTIMAQKRARKE
jgi:hypothetical protein